VERKITKANDSVDFFNARLDEVRMSGHERLRAKARMAQAEAIATALFACIGYGKRLLKSLEARPVRRPAATAH
jgi:hypothetical protein